MKTGSTIDKTAWWVETVEAPITVRFGAPDIPAGSTRVQIGNGAGYFSPYQLRNFIGALNEALKAER